MSGIDTGSLDRRIVLQVPVSAQDDSGRPETNWFDRTTVWAQIKDIASPAEETVEDGIGLARRQCWVIIRWRDDVRANMRLIDLNRGKTLRVISEPAEIGRREGLKFKAEEISTGGQEP